MKKLIEFLEENTSGDILEQEPLRKHTSWRIGGPAEVLFVPKSKEELLLALEKASQSQIPVYVLGAGTNLLIDDEGLSGLIIKMTDMNQVIIDGENVVAEAGIRVPYLSSILMANELSGFEFAASIPGSLGGAVVMNAGAHGRDISSCLKKVLVSDYNGNTKYLLKEELDFSYRNSIFKKKRDLIILEIHLDLVKKTRDIIANEILENKKFRKNKQPLGYPSAGSVFKNPEGFSAGKLIDDLGAKSWQIGQAKVSKTHANFIVNLGDAKASDVKRLIEKIQKEVKLAKEVDLETEVIFLKKDYFNSK